MAGVVGSRVPRYLLLGTTVTVAASLQVEARPPSFPGRVLIKWERAVITRQP